MKIEIVITRCECVHPELLGLDYNNVCVTITEDHSQPWSKQFDITDLGLEHIGHYLEEVLKIYEEELK